MNKLAFGWLGITMAVALGVVAGIAGASVRAERPQQDAASPAPAHATTLSTAAARVERGRYLVHSIGCEDCHSPKLFGPNGPTPDPDRMLAGHTQGAALPAAPALDPTGPWGAVASAEFTAWSGPWGTSFAANLTPDENTGIGIWTEEMFVDTVREGRHMGQSRPLLPPMPWQVYRNLTDEDLGAIYAYLRTIPPVHNRVPEPLPPSAAATAEGSPAGG
jgi:hypothetical protein